MLSVVVSIDTILKGIFMYNANTFKSESTQTLIVTNVADVLLQFSNILTFTMSFRTSDMFVSLLVMYDTNRQMTASGHKHFMFKFVFCLVQGGDKV